MTRVRERWTCGGKYDPTCREKLLLARTNQAAPGGVRRTAEHSAVIHWPRADDDFGEGRSQTSAVATTMAARAMGVLRLRCHRPRGGGRNHADLHLRLRPPYGPAKIWPSARGGLVARAVDSRPVSAVSLSLRMSDCSSTSFGAVRSITVMQRIYAATVRRPRPVLSPSPSGDSVGGTEGSEPHRG